MSIDHIGISRTGPTVLTLTVDLSRSGESQTFLLRSDAHHDNLHCDHTLEAKHLNMALERNAGILDFGDLFCAMQGKWDKRSDQDQMRDELVGKDYLDRLLKYNVDFYSKYASNWIQASPGNHETSILRHHQTDLTERFAAQMSLIAGRTVHAGSYAGWVRFQFARPNTRRSIRKVLRYTHGYGGGGPVTRDVIQSARQAVFISGADLVVSGHTHDAWEMPIMRESLDHVGNSKLEEMIFLKIPGYKDEYSSGNGWAVERGMPPKPKGAFWVTFTYTRSPKDGITIDVQRAK